MLDLSYLPSTSPERGSDQSWRFVVVGVVLLLLAAVFGCISSAIPLVFAFQSRVIATAATRSHATDIHPVPAGQLIMTGLIYLSLTVAAAWIGIASFLKHRWVRPLVIVLSTHGLIVGAFSAAAFIIMTPISLEQFRLRTAAGGGSGYRLGYFAGGVFVLVVMISIPALLLLVIKSESAQRTAEHYDLRSRWTDGLSLKMVGLVVTLAVVGIADLMLLARPVVPIATFIATGPIAVALIVLDAVALFWAVTRTYRRDLAGWWVGLIAVVLPLLLYLTAALLLPLNRYYEALGTPKETARLLLAHEPTFRALWSVTLVVFIGSFMIYMVRMRPHFTGEQNGAAEPTADVPDVADIFS